MVWAISTVQGTKPHIQESGLRGKDMAKDEWYSVQVKQAIMMDIGLEI